VGRTGLSRSNIFETEADLNRFEQNKIEFSGQASAVAVTKGAAANIKYKDGVMIFPKQKED
jgi:hypothetical protein